MPFIQLKQHLQEAAFQALFPKFRQEHIPYGKLVADGGVEGDDALYSGEAVFSGGTATLILEGVAAGNYEGFIFIDMVIPVETAPTITGDSWGLPIGGEVVE